MTCVCTPFYLVITVLDTQKWEKALNKYKDKLCEDLQTIANDLFNKLVIILSPSVRSKVTTERHYSNYERVGVMIESVKKKEDFDRFCDALEELHHSKWAQTLRSEVAA